MKTTVLYILIGEYFYVRSIESQLSTKSLLMFFLLFNIYLRTLHTLFQN